MFTTRIRNVHHCLGKCFQFIVGCMYALILSKIPKILKLFHTRHEHFAAEFPHVSNDYVALYTRYSLKNEYLCPWEAVAPICVWFQILFLNPVRNNVTDCVKFWKRSGVVTLRMGWWLRLLRFSLPRDDPMRSVVIFSSDLASAVKEKNSYCDQPQKTDTITTTPPRQL